MSFTIYVWFVNDNLVTGSLRDFTWDINGTTNFTKPVEGLWRLDVENGEPVLVKVYSEVRS